MPNRYYPNLDYIDPLYEVSKEVPSALLVEDERRAKALGERLYEDWLASTERDRKRSLSSVIYVATSRYLGVVRVNKVLPLKL